METASSVLRDKPCGRLIAQADDRHDHHEPEHAAAAEEIGLESGQANPEERALDEQQVQGVIDAIGRSADVIDQRLSKNPDHRNDEADDAGHHRNIEKPVVSIAGAIAPGFEVTPVGYEIAGSPEGLEAEAENRTFRDV